jgi:hypothetical protein
VAFATSLCARQVIASKSGILRRVRKRIVQDSKYMVFSVIFLAPRNAKALKCTIAAGEGIGNLTEMGS